MRKSPATLFVIIGIMLLYQSFVHADDAAKPADPGPPLVDVTTLIPDAVVVMRYATARNFLGRALYDSPVCMLREPVARRLAKAAESLRKKGYRIVLWDCYRPLSVQKAMWEAHPVRGEVAPPNPGSHHNRGAAVDVALADRAGKLVPLPTDFDDFSPAAWARATVDDPEKLNNRNTLQAAMREAGFTSIRREWWHFNAPNPRQYAVCDQPLPKEKAPAKMPQKPETGGSR